MGGRHQGGRYLINPPAFKHKRAPNIKVVDVAACPTCGAGVGVKCASPSGGPTQHRERRRIAVRIQNEERGI